jgi:hypothetical protein
MIVALLGAGPVMWSPAADHPLKPEQAELLKGARQHALHYSASLPDFLCDQIVRRSEDARGDGRRRQRDQGDLLRPHSDAARLATAAHAITNFAPSWL